MRKFIRSIAIISIALIAIVGVAKAIEMSLTPDELKQVVGGGEPAIPDENDTLGGYTAGDWEAADDLIAGDDLTVTDDATIGGDLTLTGSFTGSGDIRGSNEGWVTGQCTDATTTFMAVANPVSADVIVDKVFFYLENGTSTLTFDIGTSSTAYAAPTECFMDDLSVSTSTAGTATTTLLTMNTTGALSTVYGMTDPSTNSQDAVLLRAAEYINGVVTTAYTGALTEATNMFDCYYRIHYIEIAD